MERAQGVQSFLKLNIHNLNLKANNLSSKIRVMPTSPVIAEIMFAI